MKKIEKQFKNKRKNKLNASIADNYLRLLTLKDISNQKNVKKYKKNYNNVSKDHKNEI